MSNRPTLYGASYSVYVRAVRLALEEKQVDYTLVEVDVFAPSGPPSEHMVRHPFGRIPAFDHDGFALYETAAINRYIDEAFIGPRLQPEDPRLRARMGQAISILDNYAYRALVWGIYVERVEAPLQGRTPNETRIAASVAAAAICLEALDQIAPESAWLAGPEFSLADVHAAPMWACFTQACEADLLAKSHPRLSEWWRRFSERPAAAKVLRF